MNAVDLVAANTMMDYLRRSDASVRVVQLRALGGAMACVPADATAFAHRHDRILVNVAAFYDGPNDRPVREAWTTELAAALNQGNKALAFLADEGEARVRAAYLVPRGTRPAAIKARYDPFNLFSLNHNIKPRPARPQGSA